jgi:hypothetical protein
MDEYLWPVRNVAEYSYCPRLFHLMEVEGIHLPSEDTEQGNRVHKRVDEPSSEAVLNRATKEDAAPRSVRSLTLTSTQHGLTATLDLAEVSGTLAVPVEYRKGRPCYSDFADAGQTSPAATRVRSVAEASATRISRHKSPPFLATNRDRRRRHPGVSSTLPFMF